MIILLSRQNPTNRFIDRLSWWSIDIWQIEGSEVVALSHSYGFGQPVAQGLIGYHRDRDKRKIK